MSLDDAEKSGVAEANSDDTKIIEPELCDLSEKKLEDVLPLDEEDPEEDMEEERSWRRGYTGE